MFPTRPAKPSYAGVIIPFGLVGLALIAVSAWWFVVADRVAKETDHAAAGLRAAGYTVSWKDRRVTGWPFRAFVRFTDFRLVSRSGHGLAAPVLGAEAETYNLGKWVVAAPDGLVLERGAKGRVRITGKALRASVSRVTATPPQIAVEFMEPVFTVLQGDPFPIVSAKTVDLYLRPSAATPGGGDMLFRVVEGQARPGGVVQWVAGSEGFSTRWAWTLTSISSFRGRDWGSAVRAWSAAGGRIVELKGEADAAGATAGLTGQSLTVGPNGRLLGAVDLDLSEGPAALLALGQARTFDLDAMAEAAQLAAGSRGPDGRARVRLVFGPNGSNLGPIRLAPAPKVWG